MPANRRALARHPARRAQGLDAGVLPLINVVFLLLIFFMLAGRIEAGDLFPVDLPQSASRGASATQKIVVLVGADGRIAVEGKPVEESALEALVAGTVVEVPATTVWLKADGGSPAESVVRVMEHLRAAGIAELQLITLPTGR